MIKFKAVYRNGHIEPAETVSLAEGTQMEVVIVNKPTSSALEQLAPLIGIWTKEEAAEFDKVIEEEFGQIDHELWN